MGNAPEPVCYSLTIFTQRWKEIRDFYVQVIDARILSERPNQFCNMLIGGIPICIKPCENGEVVSYFQLCFSVPNRDAILKTLRLRGIIVTIDGACANFLDPERRTIRLSESQPELAA